MRFSDYDIECIQSAKAFIDADLNRHHTIAEVAVHCGINTSKLRLGFKVLYGQGPYHYLKEQRLEKAKYLLESTHKSLKQIAHDLGYNHTCNFITSYRKRFGEGPASWRRHVMMWLIFLQYISINELTANPFRL